MYSIFKFGGASIKNVEGIVNVGKILHSYANIDLVIVFSAMGKVTNMLEDVVECYFKKDADSFQSLQKVKDFHINILNELFDAEHVIFNEVNNLFVELELAYFD